MDRGSPRGFDLSQREVCCAVICYFEYFLIRLDVLVKVEYRLAQKRVDISIQRNPL